MQTTTPKISVIVPVFNTEKYLRMFFDSLLKQTMSDFEIIAIDDGSTDNSAAILKEYENKDKRVKVISVENNGAGKARNIGIEAAKGEYFSFLDSDDFFDSELLEKAYKKISSSQADIVVYRVAQYHTKTETCVDAHWAYRKDYLPREEPFSYHNMPNFVFNTFGNWTWNKMFRREFIVENSIRFQEIKRTNDLFFVNLALVLATRIALLDEELVYYRIGSETNSQATNHLAPTDFYEALLLLQTALQERNVYHFVEKSFVNLAADACVYNLQSIRTIPAFERLYQLIKDEALENLCIADKKADYFYQNQTSLTIEEIKSLSCVEFVFRELERAEKKNATICKHIGLNMEDEFDSISYRIGRFITFPVRKVNGAVRCIRDHGLRYTIRYFGTRIIKAFGIKRH